MIYSPPLSQVAKNIVKKSGLIETGRLLNEIRVDYSSQPDGKIIFQVTAPYYFEFYINEIRFWDQLISSSELNTQIQQLAVPALEKKLIASINQTLSQNIAQNEIKLPKIVMSIIYVK